MSPSPSSHTHARTARYSHKPCNTGRIVRWFLILLEFDFTIVVKKGITHQRADHLSRLINGEAPIGVNDDLPDPYLFNVQMIPEWSKDLVSMLTIGKLKLNASMDRNLSLVEQSKEYCMIARRLYKLGKDGILRLCVETQETGKYLE